MLLCILVILSVLLLSLIALYKQATICVSSLLLMGICVLSIWGYYKQHNFEHLLCKSLCADVYLFLLGKYLKI